eukprot:11216717-Lingulodinium_polyedra.AAC.1
MRRMSPPRGAGASDGPSAAPRPRPAEGPPRRQRPRPAEGPPRPATPITRPPSAMSLPRKRH